MTKIEIKLFDFIKKHITVILFIIATIIGTIIHFCGINFQSDDFNSFLNGWWYNIQAGGIKGLANQVGNYNIPYQIIICLLTVTPLSALHAYKLLSIIFDIVLAISAGMLVNELSTKKSPFRFVLTYAIVYSSITVVFNSAFWAQCDSIYVSFILLAIYFMRKDRNILAFVMLGLSLAFKLQFFFILPVFIFYYILNRKVSFLHFLIIPLTDIVMCLPAIFLGRNPIDIVKIYVDQTDYGKLIQMNCPNIYAFMCEGTDINNYYMFKTMSIVLTMLLLGIALCVFIYKKIDLSDANNFMLTAIWTSFTCLMFLSSMHERYGYLLDILLIVYVMAFGKYYWVAVGSNLVSLRGYCYYLFGNYSVVSLQYAAIFYVILYAYMTFVLYRDVISGGKKLDDTASASSGSTSTGDAPASTPSDKAAEAVEETGEAKSANVIETATQGKAVGN